MKKNYGIVGTQRSGSNYICAALRGIDGMGDPREYFSPVHIHEEGKLIQSREAADVFASELLNDSVSGDYFGFKLHYLQYFENFKKNDISFIDAFPNIKVIFLRRTDIVKQAISLWKAELTQSWTAEMDQKREAHYNFGEVRSRYFDLKIHDLMWEKYLSDNSVPFLNLIYEDLEKNEKKFFYNILSFLGESSKLDQLKKPSLKKQADKRSEEWSIRFREEFKRAPNDQNRVAWMERLRRWDATILGDDPGIWRGF